MKLLPCRCVYKAPIVLISLLQVFAVFACESGDAANPGAPPLLHVDTDAGQTRLALGQRAVRIRACGDCHQSADAGDGLLSGSTIPRLGTRVYAANLTPDIETGIGSWSDDKIVRAIHHGIDVNDAPLCAQMPRFGNIEDDEAYNIAIYLRSIPPVHHVIPESTCPPLKPHDAGADADANVAISDASTEN